MARIAWRVFPDNITLSDPDNWERLDQHRYRATRYYIAIEEHRSSDAKTTPPLLTVPVPAGVKPVFSEKRITVTTFSHAITETIQNTVSTKIATESSFKNSLSLKDGFAAELQAKISSEISESLNEQLSSTKSYQVQSTHEIVTSIAFERPDTTSVDQKITYQLYVPVWPVTWNIYLYRVESLDLTYRRFSFSKGLARFFRKVRESGQLQSYEPVMPLAQLSFYEPQEVLAVHSGPYSAEVQYPDEVRLVRLASHCEGLSVPPTTMSLEDCANIAFPESEEEAGLRDRAKRANRTRKASPLALEIEEIEHAIPKASRRGTATNGKSGSRKFQKKRRSRSGALKNKARVKAGKSQKPIWKKAKSRAKERAKRKVRVRSRV